MRKITTGCAVLISSLALATVATAANENSGEHARDLAAKQCAAEKKADKGAFKALYGDHAMRNCIKGTTPEVSDELKNASKECKAERQDDPAGFAAAYGDGSNAHGKCVSSKVKKASAEEVEEFKNAAEECRAERDADRDAFQGNYGSNENGRNALGKCVSEKSEGEGDPS